VVPVAVGFHLHHYSHPYLQLIQKTPQIQKEPSSSSSSFSSSFSSFLLLHLWFIVVVEGRRGFSAFGCCTQENR